MRTGNDGRAGGRSRASTIRAGVLLSLLLAAQLFGCAAPWQKPELSVASVELLGIGLTEQRLLLKLRVTNPNDADLTINSLAFQIEANGRSFATAESTRQQVVARHAEALLDVVALTRLGDLVWQLRELRRAGNLPLRYRLSGKVDVDGYGSVPFDRSGELPLSALDRFAPK